MSKNFSVRVHPAGALAFAAAFLFAPANIAVASCMALVIHEGGHMLMLKLCGIKECQVELTPFGGMADIRAFETLPAVKQMLCVLAGPAASLLAAVCMTYCSSHPFACSLMKTNISLCLVNLLPVWPLDGARAIIALASVFGIENAVRKAFSVLSWIVGLLISGLGLYGAWIGIANPSLLFSGPYLCYASRMGNASLQIRRLTQIQNQLKDGRMLPVRLYACSQETKRANLTYLFTNSSASHVQALLSVDLCSGKIVNIETEAELLEEVVSDNGIDKAENM